MKKALILALAAMLCVVGLVAPTSAAVERVGVVYRENFDNVKSFDELGWEPIETLTTNTASASIVDGKLLIDNLKDDEKRPTVKDSYWLIADRDIMAGVVQNDYTVQWEMTYLEAGDAARYLVILLNYDRELGNSYLSFHFRPKGYADFQTRLFGSWTTIDSAGSSEGTVTRPKAANTDPAVVEPISKYLWGKDYVDSDTYLIMNEPITVRIEYHSGKALKVFMNDKFVTATDDAGWENYSLLADPIDGWCEVALKAGSTIKATLDNVIIATGIGIPADAWTSEIIKVAAPETTAPPATTAAPETTKAPETTRAPESTRDSETTKTAETTRDNDTTKAPTDAVTTAPSTTSASDSSDDGGGMSIGLIVAVVAAVAVVGVIVYFVMKKK